MICPVPANSAWELFCRCDTLSLANHEDAREKGIMTAEDFIIGDVPAMVTRERLNTPSQQGYHQQESVKLYLPETYRKSNMMTVIIS